MENRFNLIEEPWIPVVDHGRVSLREIFTHPEYRSLGETRYKNFRAQAPAGDCSGSIYAERRQRVEVSW